MNKYLCQNCNQEFETPASVAGYKVCPMCGSNRFDLLTAKDRALNDPPKKRKVK